MCWTGRRTTAERCCWSCWGVESRQTKAIPTARQNTRPAVRRAGVHIFDVLFRGRRFRQTSAYPTSASRDGDGCPPPPPGRCPRPRPTPHSGSSFRSTAWTGRRTPAAPSAAVTDIGYVFCQERLPGKKLVHPANVLTLFPAEFRRRSGEKTAIRFWPGRVPGQKLLSARERASAASATKRAAAPPFGKALPFQMAFIASACSGRYS